MKSNPLVLAVDDNSQNLQFLGKFLADNHYEVGLATSGEQALNFIKKNPPDLILLDIMMPEMDGYEVCTQLKSQVNTSHIPVIFLTAKTDSSDVVKGFELGGVDYVTKPFHSAELLARIKTHIELKVLRGFLPMCSRCKKVRDDKGFWESVEAYIRAHSELMITHGLCPGCSDDLYGGLEWYERMKKKRQEKEKKLPGMVQDFSIS